MPRVEKSCKQFPCRKCKSTFFSHSDVQRHQTVHTGEKPFKCDFSCVDEVTKEVFVCGKGFPQRTGLKTHMNIHTGAKPHACIYCRQRFNDPSSKARHEKERHRSKGTYRCPVEDCPVGIKRRSAFVVHLKEKHGLTKDDVNIDGCAPKIEPKKSREERERAKKAFKNETADVSVERTASGHHHHAPIVLPKAPPMFGNFADGSSSPPHVSTSVKAELPELTHAFEYRGTHGVYSLPSSYHHSTSLGGDELQYMPPYDSYSPGPTLHRDQYAVKSTPPTPQLVSSSSTESSPSRTRLSAPSYHSSRHNLMLTTTQSATMYMMGTMRPPSPPRYYHDYHDHDNYIGGYSSKSLNYYSAYDLAPGVHEG